MAYYTNSDEIRELMKGLVDVDVKPIDNSFEYPVGLTFDDLFRDRALSTYRVGREGDAMTLRSL